MTIASMQLGSGAAQLVPEKSDEHQGATTRAPLFRVFVHNDEVTPMDYVVHALVIVFLLPSPNAEYIMYTAHINGRAYVQTLTRDEARRRIGRAEFAARLKGYPLTFSMEPE